MQRYCFTFQLRPGAEEEYRRRHDDIWPEMVRAIEEAGIRNYTLFRRDTQVIAYCECDPDAQTAFARIGETDVNRQWAESFVGLIESLVDADGQLREADEVWHLD
jgi:L-rhamnose mutarotase